VTDKKILTHEFGAQRDTHGRGYLGVFQGEKIGGRGTRFVCDANGMVILYECRESAERAAMRAFLAALDKSDPPRSKTARTFTVFGQGRNRKMVPL
jgi:hypothetical protein